MHHLEQEIDRHPITMMDLNSMVSQDSYARLVDLFVDSRPPEKLVFTHTCSACVADLASHQGINRRYKPLFYYGQMVGNESFQ